MIKFCRNCNKEFKTHRGVQTSCSRQCSSAKHGLRFTRQYSIWNLMKQRCSNPKAGNYKYYGKKGTTYCERWKTFPPFWEDMKDTYADHLTLDRIDNSKGYSKENCRWSTTLEQGKNKSIGDTKGEKHPNARLKKEDVLYIRKNKRIIPNKELADIFKVSRPYIVTLQSRRNWKHI